MKFLRTVFYIEHLWWLILEVKKQHETFHNYPITALIDVLKYENQERTECYINVINCLVIVKGMRNLRRS